MITITKTIIASKCIDGHFGRGDPADKLGAKATALELQTPINGTDEVRVPRIIRNPGNHLVDRGRGSRGHQ